MILSFSTKTFLTLIFGLFLISSFNSFAQTNYSNLWNEISETGLDAQGTRYIIPQEYRTLKLDYDELAMALHQAPFESSIPVQNSEFLLSIPLPNNEFATFKVVESPVMAAGTCFKVSRDQNLSCAGNRG